MISDTMAFLFLMVIILLALFVLRTNKSSKKHLIYRVYIALSACLIVWLLALIGMKYTAMDNTRLLYCWDALTYVGVAYMPVIAVVIAYVFINHYEKLPKKFYLLFIVPTLTNIMVWTNPLHHLCYEQFSVFASEIRFGPYFYFHGVYSYLCITVAIVAILRFAIKTQNRLYFQQALLFSISNMFPLVVSCMATLKLANFSIIATPLSFIGTVVVHGISISKLNYLSITPIAMQHIVNWISDGYLILSEDRLVLSYNKPFYETFGKLYGLKENQYLSEALRDDSNEMTGLYNLISSVQSCQETNSLITYEQSLLSDKNIRYYMVEVTPLFVDGVLSAYVAIFKDVTRIKESMQRLQKNQNRMMEQERLASLGQMVAGIAHNLKTPIMSISGSLSALDNLLVECGDSLGNPSVTNDDYREIYGEMEQWIGRTRDSCAYMSDIITAVKGQATNMSTSELGTFTLDELFKRVQLLMRHELNTSHITLTIDNQVPDEVLIHGDINNLVQVMNNLITNAVDVQKQMEKGLIEVSATIEQQNLRIAVKDHGNGISPEVEARLFKEMVTSKGSQGTGIGLYMSDAAIKGKFGGKMWFENDPGHGATFGFNLPYDKESGFVGEKEAIYANQ